MNEFFWYSISYGYLRIIFENSKLFFLEFINHFKGMDAIASLDPPIFNDYLKKTQNTICGRNPICVMLQSAEHFRQMNNHFAELRFLRYSQSNKVRFLNSFNSLQRKIF